MVGGAESANHPVNFAAFGAMQALSTRNDEPERASRPYDIDRDGFVMAEGAGAVVIESEEFAKARGLPVIDKPAVYETGHRQGLPLPAKFSESIADKATKTTTAGKTTTTQKEA